MPGSRVDQRGERGCPIRTTLVREDFGGVSGAVGGRQSDDVGAGQRSAASWWRRAGLVRAAW
ncbi:Os02g0566000 [Oryza sativa Japonica Group]|uniref:Os02g0566000 protein n=2 Tax=Oryza TaxID=4527 RepID=Q6YTJ1_ORYSJ|nr:unknown protein [Oryza sativa Japonica Group]BAD17746.1 unknown protein [Oryza sativa Japonica Group]BAF09083.1 Os02g0566000 [Oryza sativa Japonica Group]|eukprot:NP_001047169.1 Os02g0566000 [Oryza sativa Japonica Group]